jgi:hypothetical protein
MEYGNVEPKLGRPSVVKGFKKLAELRMFLDEDRDGTVDDEPAICEKWKWGEGEGGERLGAIIMVKTRDYKGSEEVSERTPLELAWFPQGSEKPGNWEANLTITSNPEKIRIYLDRAADEKSVLGDKSTTLGIHNYSYLENALDKEGMVRLWMEAVDYPQKYDGSDACVDLQLSFTDLRFESSSHEPTVQKMQLRIAPWIMASDLDATHKVFARVDEGGDNALAEAIKNWVGSKNFSALMAEEGQSKKGFMRDIGKCGYAAAPGISQIVIHKNLDARNLRMALRIDDAKDAPAGTTEQPKGKKRSVSQDNGGNLLVSPPLPEYPYGRIVYGGKLNGWRPNAADFYHAQLLQSPISMDSTWLDVGHIDEMLSFVRCEDGSYRALLMSPRLAYIMLRPLAGRQITGPSAIIDWATSVNDEMIRAGEYNRKKLQDRLETFPVPTDPPDPEMYGTDAIELVKFEEKPACPKADAKIFPAVTDTFVVFRVKSGHVIVAKGCLGENYDQLKKKYDVELRKPDKAELPFAQVRVQTRRFLQNFEGKILETLSIAQPPLDKARQKLEEIGFKDKIIEVPVLLRRSGGGLVGLTADSVNMLVLAKGNSCRCLVPKPFGPTSKGQYVYEEYLRGILNRLGIEYKIMADDAFHALDGEIHCGTNQIPEPLSEDLRKWWKTRPQPVEKPAPLPERKKLKGILRVSLDGEPQVDQHECIITMNENYANRKVDFPVEGYEDEVDERPEDNVFICKMELGKDMGLVTDKKLVYDATIGQIKNQKNVGDLMNKNKLKFIQPEMPADNIHVINIQLTKIEEPEPEEEIEPIVDDQGPPPAPPPMGEKE